MKNKKMILTKQEAEESLHDAYELLHIVINSFLKSVPKKYMRSFNNKSAMSGYEKLEQYENIVNALKDKKIIIKD